MLIISLFPCRHIDRQPAALLLLGLALGAPHLASAQTAMEQDTRLRLDQLGDAKSRQADQKLLDQVDEQSAPPTQLTIAGQAYQVGDTVDEVGQALYLAIRHQLWSEAQKFLSAYQKFADADPLLLLHAQGALARHAGKLAAAERYYRQLLDNKPDFLVAQLEYARILFENRKDREARQSFEAVAATLAHDRTKNASIIATVDAFLAALKRRRSWQGQVALGAIYSDNLNQSSASNMCLLTGPAGECVINRAVPKPIASAGVNFEASLLKLQPLSGHHALRAQIFGYGEIYPDQFHYSQSNIIARLGYQHQSARQSFSLSPSLELGSLGDDLLYTAYGLNGDWVQALGQRTWLRSEGNWRRYDYPLRGFAAQNGDQWDANITLSYSNISGKLTLFAGPDVLVKGARERADAYCQWGGRVGLAKAFGEDFSLFAIASYRQRDYRAVSPIFGERRADQMQNYQLILRAPKWRFAGFTPELSAQHGRTKSRIDWLYSYRRTALSLRLAHTL